MVHNKINNNVYDKISQIINYVVIILYSSYANTHTQTHTHTHTHTHAHTHTHTGAQKECNQGEEG